jgi:hypothetical protein
LKTHLVSIYEPRIPKFCFARKPTFGNWLSCMYHQANGSAHIDEGIESLLNKDNSLVINVRKDFSIEAPTPNMFSSSYGLATLIVEITNVLATRFSQSKHTIKRRTTTLTSY